ncbi:hypothetical protein [Staphylococcus edaphicus]|uniref:DUF4828 domain-containing protein n=1 Tax=Staphylococcus edaphicus TaxID=1955013 RepID=A0A2C6WLR8_9STAP|nr:hypothetical protein [Staphylococcus edaphicus]PHK49319.1 hypothetical protein BTJ66_09110 [Staphylococcus edaphicus]UQW80976.1 hypothetical protein MNY58_10365 [Staphylococcus edaphicus]
MKRIIPYIIFFMVGFLVACACSYYFQRTPDEKIKGVWEYKYNDNPQQTLYLRSSKNGMDVGTIGDKVTVFPLKKGANPDGFYFVLEEDKGNYEYYVEKKDKKHITIQPEDNSKPSLQERLFGTENLSKKTSKEKTSTLKKSK